jgi:hypothetical protein
MPVGPARRPAPTRLLARLRVIIERSTLAQWAGAGAAELQPLHDYLIRSLNASPKLFFDETCCPVLDPGRGKTKTAFIWALALARDDGSVTLGYCWSPLRRKFYTVFVGGNAPIATDRWLASDR